MFRCRDAHTACIVTAPIEAHVSARAACDPARVAPTVSHGLALASIARLRRIAGRRRDGNRHDVAHPGQRHPEPAPRGRVVSADRLRALYAVTLDDSRLILLMRYRAVLLAMLVGEYDPSLGRIVQIDLVASVVLVAAAITDRVAGSPLP